jgi:iron complex transport system ATP-binding protein
MAMNERPVLACSKVGYRGIVRDIDIEVWPGEVVALIGPNGAGKSTILRLLARAALPDAGDILLAGRRLAAYRARARARLLGYLPQQTVIDLAFSVRDVVELGFYARGRRPQSAQIDEVLTEVGLMDLQHRDIRFVSGGERQRALLGKVLAQDASVLLLDEPVSGLDAMYQLDLLDICRSVARRGRSVLITLHDMELVLRYADRAYLLSRGEIIAQGAPGEVLTGEELYAAYGLRGSTFADPVNGVARLSLTRDSDVPQPAGSDSAWTEAPSHSVAMRG